MFLGKSKLIKVLLELGDMFPLGSFKLLKTLQGSLLEQVYLPESLNFTYFVGTTPSTSTIEGIVLLSCRIDKEEGSIDQSVIERIYV